VPQHATPHKKKSPRPWGEGVTTWRDRLGVFRSGGFIPPLGGKCGEVNSPLPPDSAFSLHPSHFILQEGSLRQQK
jgi:hypothetical protein